MGALYSYDGPNGPGLLGYDLGDPEIRLVYHLYQAAELGLRGDGHPRPLHGARRASKPAAKSASEVSPR